MYILMLSLPVLLLSVPCHPTLFVSKSQSLLILLPDCQIKKATDVVGEYGEQ